MFKNKLLAVIIGLTIIISPIYVSANVITECDYLSDTEQMLIRGNLDKEIKNVLVNLYMYSVDDGSLKYIDQTLSDNKGEYSFSVDLKNRFAKGGKFIIKTKAQIEDTAQFVDKHGDLYKEFYLDKELQNIYQDIIDNKTGANLNSIIQIGFDKLTFDDEQLKNALSQGHSQQVADIIKNDTAVLTYGNIKDELKKAAIITNINHATSSEVKMLIFNNDAVLGISDNEFFKSLGVDKEKPETLNTDLVNDFCARISNSNVQIDSNIKFVGLIEDLIIVSKAYYFKGKDGIKQVLDDYSSKFNFTVYNTAGNDKDKVLKSILLGVENKSIKTISDIQKILDEYIAISSVPPKGNSGGGTGGGGVVSTPVVTIPSNMEMQNINKVKSTIPHFNDISEYKWAEESIYSLSKRGVLSGYSEGTFAPADNLTRAQLCKILCSTFGMIITDSKTQFADVDISSWYSKYVATLFTNGFVNGVSEDAFKPDENIKRQDVCVMIYRILEKENLIGENSLPTEFEDEESIDEYAKVAVKTLKAMGFISGYDGFFRPKESISRAEIAVVINKVYEFRNKDLVG